MASRSRRFRFSWTCPACAHVHNWNWPPEDRPWDDKACWMGCEGCGQETEFFWSSEKEAWLPGSPVTTRTPR